MHCNTSDEGEKRVSDIWWSPLANLEEKLACVFVQSCIANECLDRIFLAEWTLSELQLGGQLLANATKYSPVRVKKSIQVAWMGVDVLRE